MICRWGVCVKDRLYFKGPPFISSGRSIYDALILISFILTVMSIINHLQCMVYDAREARDSYVAMTTGLGEIPQNV